MPPTVPLNHYSRPETNEIGQESYSVIPCGPSWLGEPALCTHRPSLLPIEWSGEAFGPWLSDGPPSGSCGKFVKPYHLEEGEVVTRFP